MGPRLVALGNPVADHPLNRGLLLWLYGLPHESNGVQLRDALSRRRYPVSLSGSPVPTWAPTGRGDYALEFASGAFATTAAGVAAPIDYSPGTSGDVAISCWARIPAAASTTSLFLACNSTGASASGIELLYALGNTAGRMSVRTAGTTAGAASFSGGYNDGLWHHFVGLRRGGVNRLYTDGRLVNTGAANTDNATASAALNLNGRNGTAGTVGGVGVSDVRYYSRAPSDDEVWLLYDQGRRGYPDLLRRYTPRVWLIGAGPTPWPVVAYPDRVPAEAARPVGY